MSAFQKQSDIDARQAERLIRNSLAKKIQQRELRKEYLVPLIKNYKNGLESTSKFEMKQEIEKKLRSRLVGKTIKSARFLKGYEKKYLLWDQSCIALELDDGSLLFPSMSENCDAPGGLFFQSDKGIESSPVV